MTDGWVTGSRTGWTDAYLQMQRNVVRKLIDIAILFTHQNEANRPHFTPQVAESRKRINVSQHDENYQH